MDYQPGVNVVTRSFSGQGAGGGDCISLTTSTAGPARKPTSRSSPAAFHQVMAEEDAVLYRFTVTSSYGNQ